MSASEEVTFFRKSIPHNVQLLTCQLLKEYVLLMADICVYHNFGTSLPCDSNLPCGS